MENVSECTNLSWQSLFGFMMHLGEIMQKMAKSLPREESACTTVLSGIASSSPKQNLDVLEVVSTAGCCSYC